MKWHQAFTEKFYEANVGGPSKCKKIDDSFKVSFEHLSSIKFLTGYYLMSISCYNVISGYKYTEYYVTTLTQYDVIILIQSQNYFLWMNLFLIICNFYSFFFQSFASGKCDTKISIKY